MNSNINSNEKFCVKCGKKFIAVGREVICHACKEQAAEESKRAATMRAKQASWTGESVPVRISGRASTVIRHYGAAHNVPFAQALDELLKSTDYFQSVGKAWDEVEPYKSRRRSKSTTENTTETADKQEAPQGKPQEVKQAAKQAGKVTTSTTAKKTASKAVKTAAGKGGKA